MTLRRWGWPALVAAAATLLALGAAPGAAAQPVAGTLSAAGAHLEGDVQQRGLGSLVHVKGGGPQAPEWSITAQRIHTYQVEDEGHVVRAAPPVVGPTSASTARAQRSLGQAPAPEQHQATSATIRPEDFQQEYVLMVFSSGTFAQSCTVMEATLDVLQRPALHHQDGVREASGLEAGAGGNSWSGPTASAPHVRTVAPGAFHLRAEGSFTIEVMGLSGRLVGTEGGWDLTSGHWEEAIATSGAGGVSHLREVFLRIEVEDGVLDLADDGGVLQWSGPSAETTVLAGRIALEDAAGLLAPPGGSPERVQDPHMRLEPPVLLAARPLGHQMDIGVVPVDSAGRPLALPTAQAPRDPVVQGVMAAGTVLAVTVAGAWKVQSRRNLPNMVQVEAALESRDYRRAARTARRILARRPEAEDARLGLAIALSKAGRHRAVVREIEPYVRTCAPSDGVLFYVLGVAQHELGKEADARSSFREALQRTPALQADIQKRMGPAAFAAGQAAAVSAAGAASRPEPGGYA